MIQTLLPALRCYFRLTRARSLTSSTNFVHREECEKGVQMEMEILFPRTRSKVLGACPPLTKCGQYGVTPELNFIVPQVEVTFQGQGKERRPK